MTLLSACGVAPTNTIPAPVETSLSALPVTGQPIPAVTESIPNSKLPSASFESQTYINETVGFALDYPIRWTVKEQVIGDRGSQVRFLSAPELADMAALPEDTSRVGATIYQWDPKNDLAAFVANQKNAWDASGFTILEEEQRMLEPDLPAVQFTVQSPDATTIFLVTAIGDQYLVLSGEGNLDLVKEIVQRVRPISK